MTVLRPVRVGNAFEETVEHLLKHIKLGVFPAGERLAPERELSEALGISRATLREALKALVEAGYIESQRGRYGGNFVSSSTPLHASGKVPLSATEVEDVLLYRGVVEPAAAELAAKATLSPQLRQELIACLHATSEAQAANYRPLDSRLHLTIAEATGSAMLLDAVVDIRSKINELLDRIPLIPANIGHSNEQHLELVEAILHGDAERARAVATDHLEGTAALLRGFLA
ncbi:DNA-binding FadR family transcriptional regulator [Psychromicrobium silvestre]|uniref:DNA-binding FadR family transcriptional regulator n=1 Tax=Psychromicrobium silvestre TaxID=1645614 RepID=A0A7Y9S8S8_9MICC|nr:FCD domain-containing protein [Psychromicrobium silvestre]NYE96291.1 DNA-binding FadR family transcriptional regulator [Psychromicrobium silvestre]